MNEWNSFIHVSLTVATLAAMAPIESLGVDAIHVAHDSVESFNPGDDANQLGIYTSVDFELRNVGSIATFILPTFTPPFHIE